MRKEKTYTILAELSAVYQLQIFLRKTWCIKLGMTAALRVLKTLAPAFRQS